MAYVVILRASSIDAGRGGSKPFILNFFPFFYFSIISPSPSTTWVLLNKSSSTFRLFHDVGILPKMVRFHCFISCVKTFAFRRQQLALRSGFMAQICRSRGPHAEAFIYRPSKRRFRWNYKISNKVLGFLKLSSFNGCRGLSPPQSGSNQLTKPWGGTTRASRGRRGYQNRSQQVGGFDMSIRPTARSDNQLRFLITV